jgi:Flp pilus assembly protein protease CpaA
MAMNPFEFLYLPLIRGRSEFEFVLPLVSRFLTWTLAICFLGMLMGFSMFIADAVGAGKVKLLWFEVEISNIGALVVVFSIGVFVVITTLLWKYLIEILNWRAD